MATEKKKVETNKDRIGAWGRASQKQRRIWHWGNRIKAAEIRKESEEFIAGLKAARDAELGEL